MLSRSTIAGVVLWALAQAGGHAEARVMQRPRTNLIELFSQLDANNDQVLDRGEIPADGLDAFDTLLRHGDADRDGRLQGEELRSLLERLRTLAPAPDPGRAARFFRSRDRDLDGFLDRDEFPGPAPLFRRLDSNGDGKLAPEEFRLAPGMLDPSGRIERSRPVPPPAPVSVG